MRQVSAGAWGTGGRPAAALRHIEGGGGRGKEQQRRGSRGIGHQARRLAPRRFFSHRREESVGLKTAKIGDKVGGSRGVAVARVAPSVFNARRGLEGGVKGGGALGKWDIQRGVVCWVSKGRPRSKARGAAWLAEGECGCRGGESGGWVWGWGCAASPDGASQRARQQGTAGGLEGSSRRVRRHRAARRLWALLSCAEVDHRKLRPCRAGRGRRPRGE